MTMSKRQEARRRMSRLLVSEEIQRRMDRLPVEKGDFSADLLQGVGASAETAALNESEVFALFELAAKLGLRLDGGENGARLDALGGHPAVTMDFANLYRFYRLLSGGADAGAVH